ncbi:glycosyl transferase family 2 [Lutibacter profundi]|uniref:Glycosyl transferase family 2 n=1 Tax=Lutibacter profundi TaxID=1622118 RepID=A0A120IDX3_9FLAO|nr:glycosyltransferase [Lutibacter profundi]AMC09879.1 glycosyl transferase family 2 [Lutibacter profundi]
MIIYIFIAFIVIICIQFVYYIFIFGSFVWFKNIPPKNYFNQPVSVLICAKNEAENLKKNIPFFTNQNYPLFELVLINDASSDNTLKIMRQFKEEASVSIKIINIITPKSKKNALAQGIKDASYEHLLFSDSDCKPLSKNWITEMASNFNSQHKIVLGFGSYKKIKKSILNKLIRFETLLTAIQYFSYSKIGIPYMGVGRNLAYTKSLFYSVNGFAKHLKIKSGDDDLFINQTAIKKNTTICYSKDSYTESSPKTTFKSWIQQKRRHISTAAYYKPLHKFLLAFFYSSQILFWILGTILLLNLYKWPIIIFLIFIRFLFLYVIIGFSAKKLNETDLILLIPFYEIFLIFVQMFIFIKNLISKPTHW